MTTQSTRTVHVGIGSNLGDRIGYLSSAINALASVGAVGKLSRVYETAPFEVGDVQPKYLNMVVEIETGLAPADLMHELLRIEHELGRIRTRKNAARTLDLDILLIGASVIETPDLVVPHPRMHERAFVISPLNEIAPDVIHPLIRRSVRQLAAELGELDVVPVGSIDELTVVSPFAAECLHDEENGDCDKDRP